MKLINKKWIKFMNRRNFIKDFGRFSLATVATGITVSAAAKIRSSTDSAGDSLSKQVDLLKDKIESLESSQKNLMKAVCVVTAVSTGIDLSLLV